MAVETPLPPEVAALLDDAILSLEELELLMRLRSDRGPCAVSDLAQALNIPEAIADSALESLERAGFLVSAPRGKHRVYAFSPQSEALAAAVDVLVTYYRDNRMQVILTISNKAIERLRHGVLQRFSDAFRFSMGKKDG